MPTGNRAAPAGEEAAEAPRAAEERRPRTAARGSRPGPAAGRCDAREDSDGLGPSVARNDSEANTGSGPESESESLPRALAPRRGEGPPAERARPAGASNRLRLKIFKQRRLGRAGMGRACAEPDGPPGRRLVHSRRLVHPSPSTCCKIQNFTADGRDAV